MGKALQVVKAMVDKAKEAKECAPRCVNCNRRPARRKSNTCSNDCAGQWMHKIMNDRTR